MRPLPQILARMLAVSGMLLLPQAARAQVGIGSGLSQVALVAHVSTRASFQEVGGGRVTGRSGAVREASTRMHISANTGYRLIVKAAGVPASRIWVRAASGEFRELTATSSITVAQGTDHAGQAEREIHYRIASAGAEVSLPVRYEIAITPQL